MNILCATDFSSSCEPAIVATSAIARRGSGHEVVLAHSLDLLDPAVARLDIGRARAQAEDKLAQLRSRVESLGIRARTALTYGFPSEALPELAEVERASLVVVASQGRGIHPNEHPGSTAARLAQSSGIPLLVVRDPDPFEQWLRGAKSLRILLGVDRSAGWYACGEWVNRLRELGPCDVIVANVYEAAEERIHYGLHPLHTAPDVDSELESYIRRDLQERVVLRGSGEVRFTTMAARGTVDEALVQLAKTQNVDVLALGNHGSRGVFRSESVTSAALRFTKASVLLVPPAPVARGIHPPRRILVATDLSPLSNDAVAFAYSLASVRPAPEVILLHVAEPGLVASAKDASAALRELIPPPFEDLTRVSVVLGQDVAQTICAEAEKSGASLVCIGTHGRSGIQRALLGSVAERVVRECDRPVLTARALS